MPLGGDGSWVLMVGVDGCWLMPMVDGLIIPATMRSLLMFDVVMSATMHALLLMVLLVGVDV